VSDQEILLALLEKRMDFLNTIADASMLWWVSSVVFCGTIIAAVWLQKEMILNSDLFNGLFGLVTVFFASIVTYGFWTVWSVSKIGSQIELILEGLGEVTISASLYETTGIIGAIIIGNTSFLLILLAWIVLWARWGRERKLLLLSK
jgi:hypothetical protein